MKQTGLTMQEGTTSFSNLQRGTTLMRSRLLSTAAALFLLLGLVSTSAFAQVSSSANVNFFVKSFSSDGASTGGFHQSTNTGVTAQDTVGRKFDVKAQWYTASQNQSSIVYTINFPVGTVLMADAADSVFLAFHTGDTLSVSPQRILVDPSNVTMVQNDTSGYLFTKVPSISVTDNTILTHDYLVELEVYKGLYFGSTADSVNNAPNGKMTFTLEISTQAGESFVDTTSLKVYNDLAGGVTFNTAIGAYIDDPTVTWTGADTIVFVDRFGNLVPDYPAAGDSMVISVASGAGLFNLDSTNAAVVGVSNLTLGGVTYGGATGIEDSTEVRIRDMSGGGQVATGYDANDGFIHNVGVSYSKIVLGVGTAAAHTPGGLGLSFDGEAGTDSTEFTFTLYGNVGENTVLNTAAGNSSAITRARLESAASKQIGSVTVAYNDLGVTYVGGLLNGELDITIKNIFGENFDDTDVIGTDTDPLKYMFFYQDTLGIDETETGYLTSGKTVSSKHTMLPATLDAITTLANSTVDNIDGFAIEGAIGNVNASVSQFTIEASVNNLPAYLGYASHGVGDSIGVIVYAANNMAKNDTFMIKVEPGSPVAFDTDAFGAALAEKAPITGLAIDTALILVALDTSYNRVSTMDLSDPTATNAQFDLIDLPNSGDVATLEHYGSAAAINILLDGRDPKGYASTSVTDSIKFEIPAARAVLNAAYAPSAADSSFIAEIDQALVSTDSAVINLGGTGDDALGLSLNFTGVNRRLSIEFDPATIGGGFTFASREQDLALVTLQSAALVDSLESPSIGLTAMAGRIDTMRIKARMPVSVDGTANVLDQNSADSLFFLTLTNFGDAAGLPAGMTTANIEVSGDSSSFYPVSGVYQGEGDSVAFSTPITFNATSNPRWIYINIFGVVNPTIADSAALYKVNLATSATPIYATTTVSMVVDTLAQYLLVSPTADQDTVRAGVKWLSDIAAGIDVDTLTVGDTAWFQIVRADQYGNVITGTTGASFANKMTLKSVDSTSTGNSLVMWQTVDGTPINATGAVMYDTIAVKIDSVVGAGSNTSGYFADSVAIVPSSTNGGVDYDLVLSDTTNAVTSSTVTVYVKGGAPNAIALSPDTLVTGNRGATLPTITATLTDAYGNAIVGDTVNFGLWSGVVDGAFADTNDVDLVAGVDTVAVSTRAAGKAMASWTAAGTGDSVAIAVWTTGVSAVYFSALTQVTLAEGAIRVVSPADSLVPNVADADTIVANVLDADKVVAVYAKVWSSVLTVGDDGVLVASDEVAYDSIAGVAVASLDSAQVSLAIADTVAIETGSVIRYQLVAVDAVDSVTYSDTMMYVVGPTRGKRDTTANAVNVADVMRLVYLIAIDEIVPTIVDYMGLDLDQDGLFGTSDLSAELAIWKGTGTMLAGAASLENATAKSALSYEATDKKTANLALNLESSHNMDMAVFKIKYDTKKFVFGEVKATDRLRNATVVGDANESEGIYTIVLFSPEGGQILQGSGAVLNIEISAAGEKFDGVGEISLLNAEFEGGVSAEISREVLSPKALLPKAFALSQNYPNPFNPSTTIAYDVPAGDNVQVQLNVYNMRGQLVKTLVNDSKGEGSYQVQWDGSDNYGRRVSSGVFFYRIKAGEFSKTRKMVILK